MRMKPFVLVGSLMLVGVLTGASAGAAYYWRQATAEPTAATTAMAVTTTTTAPNPGANPETLIAHKLATGAGVRYEDNNRVAITLTETELNQVIVDSLAQVPEANQVLQSAQGVSTTIQGNRVRSGLTIDTANLPTENLPPEAQKILSMMTLLGNKEIYLGIEGSPRIEAGRLVLGEDTQVQVGRVNLTLTDISNITGLDPTRLADPINVNLPQAGVVLDGLEFANGTATLRGALQ